MAIRKAGTVTVKKDSPEARRIEETHGFEASLAAQKKRVAEKSKDSAPKSDGGAKK